MPDSSQHKQNTQSNQPTIATDYSGLVSYVLFSLILVLMFLAGFYYLLSEQTYLGPYLELITRTASVILNLLGETHNIVISDYKLHTILQGDYSTFLRVGKDASGLIVMLILLALTICWPSTLAKKLFACAGCILTLFFLNAVRIACTFLIEIYFPSYAASVSEIIFPLLYVLLGFTYFLVWIKLSGRHPMD